MKNSAWIASSVSAATGQDVYKRQVQRRQDAGSHSGTVGNLLHLDPVIAQIFYLPVEFTEVIHVVLIYCFILQNKYKRVAFPLHECYINIAL